MSPDGVSEGQFKQVLDLGLHFMSSSVVPIGINHVKQNYLY